MKKYLKNVNVFILAVLFLLGFSLLYFLYFRQRNQAEVYVGLSVTRGVNIPVNTVYNWVPNWLDESLVVGDREISPLGGLNAVLLDKESYEAVYYGRYVYLLLKINAIKDRSGVYLFKNKPLSVGTLIDLKLSKAQIQGLVTYVGNDKPKYETVKLKVKLVGLDTDYWIGEAIKVGSVIKNTKGEEIAKIISREMSAADGSLLTADRNKRKLDVLAELTTKKIDDNYFFSENQKVKVGEQLFLPFREGSLNLYIASVSETN